MLPRRHLGQAAIAIRQNIVGVQAQGLIVIRNGSRMLPQRGLGQAAIAIRQSIAGIQAQGLVVIRNGGGVLPQLRLSCAAIVIRRRIVGIQAQSLVKVNNGGGMLPQRGLGQAAIAIRQSMVGIQAQGLVEVNNGGGMLPQRGLGQAAIVIRRNIAGVKAQSLVEVNNGGGILLQRGLGQAAIVIRPSMVGVQAQGLIEVNNGGGMLPQRGFGQAAIVIRRNVVGVEPQGLIEVGNGGRMLFQFYFDVALLQVNINERLGRFRQKPDGLPVMIEGFFVLVALDMGQAETHVSIGVRGVLAQGRVKVLDGLRGGFSFQGLYALDEAGVIVRGWKGRIQPRAAEQAYERGPSGRDAKDVPGCLDPAIADRQTLHVSFPLAGAAGAVPDHLILCEPAFLGCGHEVESAVAEHGFRTGCRASRAESVPVFRSRSSKVASSSLMMKQCRSREARCPRGATIGSWRRPTLPSWTRRKSAGTRRHGVNAHRPHGGRNSSLMATGRRSS